MTPLLFDPIYHERIWGGTRISTLFGRSHVPLQCGESWEISDRNEMMSRVASGPLQGTSLHSLVQKHQSLLLGSHQRHKHFPLLIKLIDAHQPLSVQVHPGLHRRASPKDEPKTELWYVLEGGPIYLGWNRPIQPSELLEAIEAHRLSDLLYKTYVSPGDVVLIPGGCVHALGEGCMVLEIQQNSDTTYRLYDWDRTYSNGSSRPLHIPQALACIEWNTSNQCIIPKSSVQSNGRLSIRSICTTFFCTIEQWDLSNVHRIDPNSETVQIFFHLSGLQMGTTWLMPAQSNSVEIPGPTSLLNITLNQGN